uniref:USP domain-containing protein n=1 Tax=viral metagenome TaxID=1070528 RepID=A0A6C0IRA0_9ZZZZ
MDKYENNGLSGLVNLGNTCFINSALQVLSHTYELNDFLNKEIYKKRLNLKNKYDSVLLVGWDNLRKKLWAKNEIVVPREFMNIFQQVAKQKGADTFLGFNQNDLPEFLIFIIDCFHNALSRQVNMTIEGEAINEKDKIAIKCFQRIKEMHEKDYSEIWNLFYGIQVSQLTEKNTHQILSMTPEPFFIINLPIPTNTNNISLIDCFNLYIRGEILDGDNMVTNEQRQEKVVAIKNLMFWSFPDILVIDIKRFNYYNYSKKNQVLVDFPLENLDLSPYVIGYNKYNYKYDLYGVCNHSGSTMGGHYTSFVKNANGKWYHFNDTRVSEVSELSQIISPKAYCFFYRKKQT